MAKPDKQLEQEKSTDVAVHNQGGAIVGTNDAMFAEDANAGMEGTTQESFAIPFLSVLQKGSPQVDEALPTCLPDAKAGMFFENVTNRMFDGKTKGVHIIPCAYRRVFIRWGAKDAGGGFKGEMAPEAVAKLRAEGKIVELEGKLYFPDADGTVNEKKSDHVKDTRNHYVLLVDGDSWTPMLLSLTSTQIKKSKMLMTMLSNVKANGPSGKFTPPTFASIIHATSLPESNDKGSWFGIKFDFAGKVARAELYAAAKAFHATALAGAVEVRYEAPADSTDDGKF